jgi:hypothetical protein
MRWWRRWREGRRMRTWRTCPTWSSSPAAPRGRGDVVTVAARKRRACEERRVVTTSRRETGVFFHELIGEVYFFRGLTEFWRPSTSIHGLPNALLAQEGETHPGVGWVPQEAGFGPLST